MYANKDKEVSVVAKIAAQSEGPTIQIKSLIVKGLSISSGKRLTHVQTEATE